MSFKMGSIIREDLKHIFNVCVNSVKPENLIKQSIHLNGKKLVIKQLDKQTSFSLENRELYIVGAGNY